MKRFLFRFSVVLAVLALVLAVGWQWLVRSAWLREQVRTRVVQEVERATGGRVELARFDFDPSLLGA